MDARRTALVEQHLPLVEQVVLRISGSFPKFVDRSELISAGMMGLVEAGTRYDFDRGIPFGGFAVQRIRGAVLDVARSADWAPRSLRQLARDAEDATATLAVESRCVPSDEEVAERLGVSPVELRNMRERITLGVTRSLDPSGDLDRGDDADQLVDRGSPLVEELLENSEMQGYLRAALDSLPERLRIIIVGLYLENRSFDELADLLGVTTSRVSQLRADAIEMIRDGIEAQFVEVEDRSPAKPKGRVAIRQARFAADIARHSDMRTRLGAGEDRMPIADVPDSPIEWTGSEPASGAPHRPTVAVSA
ncbi:MAG: sigma-70 family RNA polymerase sigma factor [Microthrixaceae bacterium]